MSGGCVLVVVEGYVEVLVQVVVSAGIVLNCVSVIVETMTTSEGVVTVVVSVETLAGCDCVKVEVVVATYVTDMVVVLMTVTVVILPLEPRESWESC